MTVMNEIRAALEGRLLTTVGIPTVSVPNVLYNPDSNDTFIKATVIPISRRAVTQGLNPQQRYDGLFSMIIHTPEGVGSGAATDIADDLLERFNATTDISLGAGRPSICISYSEVRLSYFDDPYYCTPVIVGWFLHTQ
jgi:hypothetical protein